MPRRCDRRRAPCRSPTHCVAGMRLAEARHSDPEEQVALPCSEARAEEEELSIGRRCQGAGGPTPTVSNVANRLAASKSITHVHCPREHAVLRSEDEGELDDSWAQSGSRSR